MTVHDITSPADWERAMADPQVTLIRFRSDLLAALVYTGQAPATEPTSPIIITADPGVWVDRPEADRG